MNSSHQWWSLWIFDVIPFQRIPLDLIKLNCARFGRKAFGSASQMRVTTKAGHYTIAIRTEGHPPTDPSYVDHMKRSWKRFFEEGFGSGTISALKVKLEAGSPQDGRPSNQLILLPTVEINYV